MLGQAWETENQCEAVDICFQKSIVALDSGSGLVCGTE